MRMLQLFFLGRFENAYVYMGRLVILTEERTLLVCNLKRLITSLEGQYPAYAPILSMMFTNNDWLMGQQFKASIRNRDIAQNMLLACDRVAQSPIVLNGQTSFEYEERVEVSDEVILDMLLYSRRLYLAGTDGFYHVDLDWDSGTARMREKPTKRLDAYCIRTTAGYGAVNVSCGDDGLFSSIDEFGWLHGRNHGYPDMVAQDEQSAGTAWAAYDLMNYRTFDTPFLLRNQHEKLQREIAPERERTVLTQIGVTRWELQQLIMEVQEKYVIPPEDIQYMYNDDKQLFIHTFEGYFYVFQMGIAESGAPFIRMKDTYKSGYTRILNAYAVDSGLIVETDEHILLFADGTWTPILNDVALSIKTFQRSDRYRNLVAITLEEGLLLTSLFDERILGLTEVATPALREE